MGLSPRGWRERHRVQRTRQRGVREELDKAKAKDVLVPQVAWGYYAANGEGDDLVLWTDESRAKEFMRLTFPRQVKEPFLCIADFVRPADSGEVDYASFQLVTMGSAISEETARLYAENLTPNTCSYTASGWRWLRRWRSTGTTAFAKSGA